MGCLLVFAALVFFGPVAAMIVFLLLIFTGMGDDLGRRKGD